MSGKLVAIVAFAALLAGGTALAQAGGGSTDTSPPHAHVHAHAHARRPPHHRRHKHSHITTAPKGAIGSDTTTPPKHTLEESQRDVLERPLAA